MYILTATPYAVTLDVGIEGGPLTYEDLEYLTVLPSGGDAVHVPLSPTHFYAPERRAPGVYRVLLPAGSLAPGYTHVHLCVGVGDTFQVIRILLTQVDLQRPLATPEDCLSVAETRLELQDFREGVM